MTNISRPKATQSGKTRQSECSIALSRGMPFSIWVSNAWVPGGCKMPNQGVCPTENLPTPAYHSHAIERPHRWRLCPLSELCTPFWNIAILDRGTAARIRSSRHMGIMGVDVTSEVDPAMWLASISTDFTAKVSRGIRGLVVRRALALCATRSCANSVRILGVTPG